MTELSGTLEGVGLPAIVRFLTELEKTGSLRIVHNDWQGEIIFEAGRLTDASLGSRHGMAALDGLVQALPGGSFTFDTSSRASSAPNIELSPEALRAHLDELMARIAGGTPRLPSVDAVPELVAAQEDSGAGDDPLPLDRGTLQTLLTVNGQRTVREIVAQRGTFDALWQLGGLAEVGLIRLAANNPTLDAPREEPARLDVVASVEPSIVRPTALDTEPEQATGHCPKLGFEDDPGNSFGRPTRLHRCFAAGTPLPLSLDQQRELCLSDQFGTCPRLGLIGRDATRAPASDAPTASTAIGNAGSPTLARGLAGHAAPALGVAGRSQQVPAEPEPDHPRIVRLPFGGRSSASQRGPVGERQTGSLSEPTQLLSASSALRNADSPRPTPLRAPINRGSGGAAATAAAEAEPAGAPTHEPRSAPPLPGSVRNLIGGPILSRFGAGQISLIVGAGVLLTALVVIAFLLAPQLGSVFVDDTADLSGLPNASAMAAGTPISAITARRTPVANAPSGGTSASAASAASAPAAPTLMPEAAPATPEPTVVASQSTVAEPAVAAGVPAATQAASAQPATQPAGATLLDERFADNARNWPSNSLGSAWLTNGSYRVMPRQAGKFVAIGAPIADLLKDVVVSATFRKLSGSPAGGGFGIIVRDQGTDPRDGANQGGQYYVLEVGDKGEVGIWRREVDHWVDLLPWQQADAVRPGTATNDLTVSAIGNRLTMSVNGTQVVTRTDSTFTTGRVGLLVGGDGNQVAVDRFSVQTP